MLQALVRYESPARLSSRRISPQCSARLQASICFRGCPILAGLARVGIFGSHRLSARQPLHLNPHPLKGTKDGAPAGTRKHETYFAKSRCTTLDAYPFSCSVLCTDSASITERCRPPVQPNAIVR